MSADDERNHESGRGQTGCVLSSEHQQRTGLVIHAPTARFMYVSLQNGPSKPHEGDGRSAGTLLALGSCSHQGSLSEPNLEQEIFTIDGVVRLCCKTSKTLSMN